MTVFWNAFDLFPTVYMTKAVAIVEVAVCFECHRMFVKHIALKKHAKSAHKQKDRMQAYGSIKTLQGACQQGKYIGIIRTL